MRIQKSTLTTILEILMTEGGLRARLRPVAMRRALLRAHPTTPTPRDMLPTRIPTALFRQTNSSASAMPILGASRMAQRLTRMGPRSHPPVLPCTRSMRKTKRIEDILASRLSRASIRIILHNPSCIPWVLMARPLPTPAPPSTMR